MEDLVTQYFQTVANTECLPAFDLGTLPPLFPEYDYSLICREMFQLTPLLNKNIICYDPSA